MASESKMTVVDEDVEEAAAIPIEDKAILPDIEYDLAVDATQDDRATELKLFSAKHPHMRAFHSNWIAFFFAFISWFAIAPILPEIKKSLDLTSRQIFISNAYSIAATVLMRLIVGPLCDQYGPKTVLSVLLVLGSIPLFLVGTITNFVGLCVVRFFIGAIGASFVMSQYWSAQMFARNIVGTATATVAGWGNLGGGVTQILIGAALYPLFVIICGDREVAWRTVLIVPAFLTVLVGLVIYKVSWDTPHGDFKVLFDLPPTRGRLSFYEAATKLNTIVMAAQYGCCFGVEITMYNVAATYFKEDFGESLSRASSIASAFGFMNLVARSLGGIISDWLNERYKMRGRLMALFGFLLLQGALLVVFSLQRGLGPAIATMCLFSICVQAAEGCCFAIVPYIDPPNLGAVNGIVGAGGNLGAVIWAIIFVFGSSIAHSLRVVGYAVCGAAFLTFVYRIPGHLALVGGEDIESEQQRNARGTFFNRASRNTAKPRILTDSLGGRRDVYKKPKRIWS